MITLSSTKAEYIAETHAAKEAMWLRTFISKITKQGSGPLTIIGDNQGAITLAKDNKFHSWMKHIDLRYHFIREAVEDGKVEMKYIPTGENISDIFTKALAKPKFTQFVGMLGLVMMKES
jgi:hypothetical protein